MNEEAEADDVRIHMEKLRRDLGRSVEDEIGTVKAMFDWRHCVVKHPWLCLSAAAAAGFLLVPRRIRFVELVPPDGTAKRDRVAVKLAAPPVVEGGIIGGLTATAARMAVNAAVSKLSQYVEGRLHARKENCTFGCQDGGESSR
jgi:hypothetical protein